MSRRVVFSFRANAYVLQELTYLRSRSRSGAVRFRKIIEMAKRHLERFDEIGTAHSAPPLPGLRRLVIQDYLLDYMPGNPVVVLSIRHGRQCEPWEQPQSGDTE